MAAPINLTDRIELSPFMRIIVPFIAGIIAAGWIEAPQWFVWATAIAIYGAAWALRKTEAGWWYLSAAILTTGVLLAKQTEVQAELPRGKRLLIVAEIGETPYTQGRWARTTAQTGYFRPYDFGYDSSARGSWQRVSEKIQLYIDTCYRITAGEQVVFRGYLNPIDTTGSSYGRLMQSRGMEARSYLVPGALVARMTPEAHNLSYWAGLIQRKAVERIMRLGLGEQDRNMVATLVAGERRGMDRGLREAYSLTGWRISCRCRGSTWVSC